MGTPSSALRDSNIPDGDRLKRRLGKWYLQILDALDDMVLVKGPHSRIVWANRAFREYYGMSNKQLENIIDAPFNEPDYTNQYVKDDAYVFNTGMILNILREPVTRHDGVVRIFSTVKSPILDTFGKVIMTVGVSRDITDREAQEKIISEQRHMAALQKSNERFRTLFDTMCEGFAIHELIFDGGGNPRDFRYVEVNPSFERQTGLKVGDVVGRTLLELWPNIEPFWIEQYAKVVLTGEPSHFEAQFGPLQKWFDVSTYPTNPNQFAVVFFDITERKKVELELLAAKEAAESAARLKSQFLNIAAHELRTPVTAFSLLLQYCQMQLEKKGKPVDSPTLLRLRSHADRLAKLVVDLFDVSRLERGIVTINRESTDIVRLISDCVESCKLRAPLREIKLSKSERSILLGIDPVRIYQVISNLLDNAIKYTPEDSPIEVTVESTPTRVQVSVEDHGPGISDQELRALFKPFSRGASDQEERTSGLGLGLFICNSIIELHGGTIRVKSIAGAGSKFSFELPREEK